MISLIPIPLDSFTVWSSNKHDNMAAENLIPGSGPTDLEPLRPADDQGLSELDTESLSEYGKGNRGIDGFSPNKTNSQISPDQPETSSSHSIHTGPRPLSEITQTQDQESKDNGISVKFETKSGSDLAYCPPTMTANRDRGSNDATQSIDCETVSGLENAYNLPGNPEERDQQGNDAATSGNPEVEFGADDAHALPPITQNSDHQNLETAISVNRAFECGSDDAYNSSSLTNNRDRKSKSSAMPANSEVDPAQDGAHTVSNPLPRDRTSRQNILLHNSHCHGNDSINSAMTPPPRPRPTPPSPSQKRQRGNSAYDAFAPSGSSRYQNRSPNYQLQSYNGTSRYSTREGNSKMSGSMGPPAPRSMDFDPVLLNSAYDPANSPSQQSSRPRHQWNKLDYHLKLPNPSSKDLEHSETQNEDAFDQDDVNMSLAVLMELASDLSLLKSFLRLYKQFDTHLGGETLQSKITLTLY